MKRKITVRIPRIIIFIVVFLFIAIIIRLSYISLSTNIDGINLHEFADNRNTKSDVIYAKRGNIYDNDNNILASIGNTYKIIAYVDFKRTTNPKKPEHVVDIEATAKMLNEYLGIDYDYAIKRLNSKAYQVEFGAKGKNIKEITKNKIEELNMPGIDFIASQKRTYSMGSFASYIIGYAKSNEESDEIKGELGIEKYFNKELSGTNGKTTYQTDAYGYTLPSAEVIKEDATDGNDIHLTIDSNIQLFAEDFVRNLKKDYEMDWMILTVMDAKTGAIVASSTYPNFNPNDLGTLEIFVNPLVSYEYEPGSTMKIFSFASSIEEGLYNGSEEYKSGSYEVGGAVIKDHNKHGWGTIDYDQGFVNSSNVAASKLAVEKLKRDKLRKYYENLGFGQKTGITLASEVDGKIAFKYDSEVATASFGQGITVTAVQMLQALSALTNEGTILEPYVVSKIVDHDGNIVLENKRKEVKKVYSKETVDYMLKLMHRVVNDNPDSYWRPSKTTLAGKTGTAQIASKDGGYETGAYNYVRSFAGIFPEENPEYIVYVAVKKLSSANAKPIGDELTKLIDKIVSNKGLQDKKNNTASKIIKLDNYISKEVTTTVEELKNKKLKVYTMGTGKYVTNQYPLKGTSVLEGSKVFLISNKSDYVMPNIIGWSLNEVQTFASLLGLNLNVIGYGYVKEQSIVENTPINSESNLTVTLSR